MLQILSTIKSIQFTERALVQCRIVMWISSDNMKLLGGWIRVSLFCLGSLIRYLSRFFFKDPLIHGGITNNLKNCINQNKGVLLLTLITLSLFSSFPFAVLFAQSNRASEGKVNLHRLSYFQTKSLRESCRSASACCCCLGKNRKARIPSPAALGLRLPPRCRLFHIYRQCTAQQTDAANPLFPHWP